MSHRRRLSFVRFHHGFAMSGRAMLNPENTS
jgi:hypothetical protein